MFIAAALALALRSLAQGEPPTHPPAVEKKVDAVYPAGAHADKEVTVMVRVTIGVDGAASMPEIVESGGPAFDAAALAAIEQWKFRPAMRDGVPVQSRVRIPFKFPANAAAAPDAGIVEAPSDGGVPVAPQVVAVDAGPAAPLPQVTEVPAPQAPAPAEPEEAPAPAKERHRADGGEEEIDVVAARPVHQRPVPSRGTSDFQIETAQLAQVPHTNASDFLKLAPGVLLTNEGGEGHAEQVFLRGFDAREGQDIEFSVDGVPINESGNFHGNGYSDTHFIIPELIESLRVLEGPFDPRQGNYAVAGSAEYHLGLADRGMVAKVSDGSYGTQRALIAYGPPGASNDTFVAAQIYQTQGYGQNRDGHDASAIAQIQGKSGASQYRVTAQAYTASFHTAGVLRDDDVAAGHVGFYDTYDPRQGEDGSRYSISAALESRADHVVFSNQVYAIYRPLRLREDFTGFLLDVQEPQQEPHGQRGDLIDLQVNETTLGARGWARWSTPWLDAQQQIELGYFARHDVAGALQQRIEAATNAPYLTDANLLSQLDDIGLYFDANLRLLPWLALRGGVRGDLFTYNVQNFCAVQSVENPSKTNPEPDVSCQSQENFGAHREPNQSVSTASTATMPRASLIFGPWSGVSFSASGGKGVRSIDPVYVTQDRATPFASVDSGEVGVTVEEALPADLRLVFASTGFWTHVDQDLIFDQTAGRNTLAGATNRLGSANALRVSAPFFDVSANATFVHATFADTHLLIPYVPDLVLRGDGSVWRDLPWFLDGKAARATFATGVTFVGRRPLPYGTRSDRIFTIDTNLEFGWPVLRAGLSITNILNTEYRLGEYNFASDFHTQSEPTLVPVRHFAAGAPRALLFTLTTNFGGGAQ